MCKNLLGSVTAVCGLSPAKHVTKADVPRLNNNNGGYSLIKEVMHFFQNHQGKFAILKEKSLLQWKQIHCHHKCSHLMGAGLTFSSSLQAGSACHRRWWHEKPCIS